MINKTVKVMDIFSVMICRDCPECLFIYGDNENRKGKGGQAVIREEPNTIGICTKGSTTQFWSDDDIHDNMATINTDINLVKFKSKQYQVLVFPTGGLGTGLARLHTKAPKTFLYLCERLLDEFGYNNLAGLNPIIVNPYK